jgi:rubrerythrin
MSKKFLRGILGLVALSMVLVFTVNCTEQSVETTLENLQTAYNGESNAKARYEAFAIKADAEGYKSVASLYRATSMSEGIHAAKHAEAIKKLGAAPKATIEKPEVKSTKENLEASIKGETYEKDTMYPAFIKKAEADKNKSAVQSFKGAMMAEVEHAKLYTQALKELSSWKEAGKEFLVCPVCGYTTVDKNFKLCSVCSTPRSKFAVVK